MKNLILILLLPFLSSSQELFNPNYSNTNIQSQGCVDLDETIIDLVSIFGDASLLDGLLGCAEIIPTLESGILSAFLPFKIPLDCNTDLSPFGYLDMNVSNICECSCQPYLTVSQNHLTNRKLLRRISILGGGITKKGFQLYIYDDGYVEKIFLR